MFSFEKRTNAINYGDKDRAEINQLILAVQSKHEKQFSNVKELFEFLLNQALSETEPPEIVTEIETKTIEIVPENALILDDSNEIAQRTKTLLEEFANWQGIGEKSPSIAIETAMKLASQEPEIVEKTIEIKKELEENQMIVAINPNQKMILEKVVENRRKQAISKNKQVYETADQILVSRFFHWDVLENWTGEFFTGLKK